MTQQERIKKFIKTKDLTVISTVDSNNVPESAVIRFARTPNLSLIFNTFKKSKKYKNLMVNPSVSFVIGWDERITVQYVGVAQEVHDKELEEYKKLFYDQYPRKPKFKDNKDLAFFKVTPKWIRYSDLNQDPWEIFEIKTF